MIVGLAHSINSVLRPAKANPRSRGPLTNHSYLLVETTRATAGRRGAAEERGQAAAGRQQRPQPPALPPRHRSASPRALTRRPSPRTA
jgi:hypothetical protein